MFFFHRIVGIIVLLCDNLYDSMTIDHYHVVSGESGADVVRLGVHWFATRQYLGMPPRHIVGSRTLVTRVDASWHLHFVRSTRCSISVQVRATQVRQVSCQGRTDHYAARRGSVGRSTRASACTMHCTRSRSIVRPSLWRGAGRTRLLLPLWGSRRIIVQAVHSMQRNRDCITRYFALFLMLHCSQFIGRLSFRRG